MKKGITFLSQWYQPKYTPDEVFGRDFSLFKADGIEYVRIPLLWSLIEGATPGDYTPGDAYLPTVLRALDFAQQYGLKAILDMHVNWGSSWSNPAYAVDPLDSAVKGLAIVRSNTVRSGFLSMYNHLVNSLKGHPAIGVWELLTNPWYYPKVLPAPLNTIDQRDNFITLMQQQASMVKSLDGKPCTLNFPCVNISTTTGALTDIFTDNFGWDERIFQTLDMIGFVARVPDNPASVPLYEEIFSANVTGAAAKKPVWILHVYSIGTDQEQVADYEYLIALFKTLPIAAMVPWMWHADYESTTPWEPTGTGSNLAADMYGNPRPAYDVFVTQVQPPTPGGSNLPLILGGVAALGGIALLASRKWR